MCPESCEVRQTEIFRVTETRWLEKLRRVALCAKKVFGDTCRLA